MKKRFLLHIGACVACFFLFSGTTFAANILGVSSEDLRNGNIDYTKISVIIANIIRFLMAIAGSVAVVALIYHAVKMQLASGISGDSSGVEKAKKGMFGSVIGFILAMLAYFLMSKFISLLGNI